MSNLSDRPSPVECAMCRKRLSNLEQVQADHGARLAGQAEEMRLVRESIVTLHAEMTEAMTEFRHNVLVSLDVLRVELVKAHEEVRALAGSNMRIENLLERVLEGVGHGTAIREAK